MPLRHVGSNAEHFYCKSGAIPRPGTPVRVGAESGPVRYRKRDISTSLPWNPQVFPPSPHVFPHPAAVGASGLLRAGLGFLNPASRISNGHGSRTPWTISRQAHPNRQIPQHSVRHGLEGARGGGWGAWETAYIYMDTEDGSRGLGRASPNRRAPRPPVSADRAGPQSAGRARHRCRPSTAALPEEAGILPRRSAASLRHRWDDVRPGAQRRFDTARLPTTPGHGPPSPGGRPLFRPDGRPAETVRGRRDRAGRATIRGRSFPVSGSNGASHASMPQDAVRGGNREAIRRAFLDLSFGIDDILSSMQPPDSAPNAGLKSDSLRLQAS